MSKKKVVKERFINTGAIVNTETGEIFKPEHNYEIQMVEYLDDHDDNKLLPFKVDTSFVKIFRGSGIMLDKELTDSEIAALVFLQEFVCYEDCVLRRNGDSRGKPLTIQELADIREYNYNTFRSIMTSLKKKEIIGYHTTGDRLKEKWITVNPYIFCRGNKVSSWIIDFYKDTKWARRLGDRSNNAKKQSELKGKI